MDREISPINLDSGNKIRSVLSVLERINSGLKLSSGMYTLPFIQVDRRWDYGTRWRSNQDRLSRYTS
jgi:hypothetical protein